MQAKVFCEIATVHPKDIQHIIQADTRLHDRLHRYVALKKKLEGVYKDGEVDELEVTDYPGPARSIEAGSNPCTPLAPLSG